MTKNLAKAELIRHWGWTGMEVISACEGTQKTKMSFDDFLGHCFMCGGNWTGMLLTGIKNLYPRVWNAIPEDMGDHAWDAICAVLELLDIYHKNSLENEE